VTAILLRQILDALQTLNPRKVQELAERRFTLGLLAADEFALQAMVRFLLPPGISRSKARLAASHIFRIEREADFDRCDFGLAEPHLDRPPHFFAFEPSTPARTMARIVDQHEELWIPVARQFVVFRNRVTERLVGGIARENAVFAAASAARHLVPAFIELPGAAENFASDITFLTMNQIRMAFLIAAASDAPVGYRNQQNQIASIVTSAFGWRALARKIVPRAPFCSGVAPKGLIAYAGTYVVGMGLKRYQQVGRGLTAQEKRDLYSRAYQGGLAIVEELVGHAAGRPW